MGRTLRGLREAPAPARTPEGRDVRVSTVAAGHLRSWRWGVRSVRPTRARVTGAGCCIHPGLIPAPRRGRKSRRPLYQRHGRRLSEFSTMPGVSRPGHGWLPRSDTPRTRALPTSPPNRATALCANMVCPTDGTKVESGAGVGTGCACRDCRHPGRHAPNPRQRNSTAPGGRGERPTPGGQADNCADLHNFRGLDTLHPSACRPRGLLPGQGKPWQPMFGAAGRPPRSGISMPVEAITPSLWSTRPEMGSRPTGCSGEQ